MTDREEIELGSEAPTALYRLYDSAGLLLYVGITGELKQRLTTHASSKAWWPRVGRKTVVWYLTRAEALTAEDRAIRDERPVFNQVGSPGSVARRQAARAAVEAKRAAIWGRSIPADVGDLC